MSKGRKKVQGRRGQKPRTAKVKKTQGRHRAGNIEAKVSDATDTEGRDVEVGPQKHVMDPVTGRVDVRVPDDPDEARAAMFSSVGTSQMGALQKEGAPTDEPFTFRGNLKHRSKAEKLLDAATDRMRKVTEHVTVIREKMEAEPDRSIVEVAETDISWMKSETRRARLELTKAIAIREDHRDEARTRALKVKTEEFLAMLNGMNDQVEDIEGGREVAIDRMEELAFDVQHPERLVTVSTPVSAYRGPSQALHLREEVRDWWQTEMGVSWAEKLTKVKDPAKFDPDANWQMADLEPMKLKFAAPYYVERDIGQLVRHMADELPGNASLDADDVTEFAGFAYFETVQRLQRIDMDPDEPLMLRAVSWRKLSVQTDNGDKPGIHFTFYVDRSELVERSIYDHQLQPDHTDHEDPDPDDLRANAHNYWPEVVALHHTGWVFGRRIDEVPDWYPPNTEDVVRFMTSFFKLERQEVYVPRHENAHRQLRRGLMRKDVEVPTIRVVVLRREKGRKPKESNVEGREYSHRFVVHGFWRNQWYPSEGRHKPKYINSFIKGPPDKPLIIKERVYKFSR